MARGWLVVVAVMVAACGGGGGAGAAASSGGESLRSDVTVRNESNYAIHRFHMSPVGETTWGPDQLGEDILASGGTFTLTGVPCDSYDVRLVDEDGDECVVRGVAVCAEEAGWVIGNDDLLSCEGFAAAE